MATIINMKINTYAAGLKIASMIRENMSTAQSPICIGITNDGEIEGHHLNDLEDLEIIIYDTSNGCEGMDCDPADWDDEDERAVSNLFSDGWIQDAVWTAQEDNDYFEVNWPA